MATESEIQNALQVLQQDYWDDVRAVADGVIGAIQAGEVADAEAVREYLEQTVDGHARVIYTREAILCLLFSRYDEEAIVEGLVSPTEFAEGVPYSQLACVAFLRDVEEEIASRGVDLDDPLPADPEDESEAAEDVQS